MISKLLELIQRANPKLIAEEICSVQPMNGEAIKILYETSVDEKQLEKEGYKPVCETTRLMWVKK